MREMTNEMKVIKSEFNLASTQAKLFGDETELLKAKENELTSTLKVQNNMLKLQESQYNSLVENSNKLKAEQEQLAQKVNETTEKYKESVNLTGKNSEESKNLKIELEQLSSSYAKVDKALTVNNNKLTTATTKFNTTKVSIMENSKALEDLQDKINNVGMEKLSQEEEKVDRETQKLNRRLEILKAQLGGEIPESTEKAFLEMQKINREIRSAGREFGRHSIEVMNARNKLTEFALGLDDTTFKQIYMKSQLGLTNGQLNQQANSIKLNARMVSLMGSQTEILINRMKGLQEHGIKPEDFKTASTIGQFQMLNETMGATDRGINKLSQAYRTMGAGVEKNIKGWSAQKLAMKEANGDMVKYGLLLRGMTATQANMGMAFTAVGVAAGLFYTKLFSSAIEADEGLKGMVDTLKGQLTEAFKPLIQVAGEFLKAIIPIISKVAEMVINFNNAHPTIAKVLAAIGFLAPAMTLLLLPLSSGIGLLGGWKLALNGLWVLMGPVITTIGTASATFFAFAGIGAVVGGAFVLMYNKCEWFRNGINNLGTWLKNFFTTTIPEAFKSMINFFKELPSKASEMWNDFKNNCVSGFNKVSNFFTVTIPQTFNNIINFFKNNWKQILLFIVSPFAGAFAMLYKHNETFRNKVNELMTAIKNIFVNSWNSIKTFFTTTIPQMINNIGIWFSQLPFKIAFAFGEIIGSTVKWGVDMYNYFTTNIPMWIENISTWFSELPAKVQARWNQMVTDVVNWGINMYANISTTVTKIITDVVQGFSELPGRIKAWWDKIISDAVAWGTNMYTNISTSVNKVITDIVKWFSELPAKIQLWLNKIVTDVVTWGTNMYNTSKKSVGDCVSGIIEWFGKLPIKMVEIGTNIVNGIKEGIKSAWNGMIGWIGDLCDNFVDGIKDKFDIHSPSRVMAKEIGKYLPQGIGVGFQSELPNVNADIKKNLTSTVDVSREVTLKHLNSTSSKDKFIEKILDKMDRLEKALDIKLDGDSIVRKTAEKMDQELAYLRDRRYFE